MFRIGIYTGRTYCGVGDDPKECYIECLSKDLKEAKERAWTRKLMWCHECTDCEEAKKNEDSWRSN